MQEKKKPLIVGVETLTFNDEGVSTPVIERRIIDYSVYENREWLAKHCVWAFHNGYSILTYKTDEEPNFGSIRVRGKRDV